MVPTMEDDPYEDRASLRIIDSCLSMEPLPPHARQLPAGPEKDQEVEPIKPGGAFHGW